ncbi:MAG: hypothetical protein ACK5JR_19415 [Tropicimonas sp.]|uniref:hypothetical protein n=1 Tax=Tropicimonas sp. TaxID=2067044 RepID=UPI003A8ACDE5
MPENLLRLRSTVTVGAVETCVHAACDMVETPPGRFRDMLASDIAALGLIMTEVMDAPLLHRSPPIEGTGETRLLAVIDPASDHATNDGMH